MNRLCLLLLVALPLSARQLPAQEAEQPEPAPTEQPAPDAPPESAEIPDDFTEFLRNKLPGVDPAGEHSLADLKNYSEKDKRHRYTGQMANLLLIYITDLNMGGSLTKLFDHYATGKHGENPSFRVLHALVLSQYPPGMQNLTQAEKILRELVEQHPDFAYAHYYLAQVELMRIARSGGSDLRPLFKHLDAALAAQPSFVQARALKAEWLINTKRKAEALELIEPLMKGELPALKHEYEELLVAYARAADEKAFHAVVDEHLKREKLPATHRRQALLTKAGRYFADQKSEDALAIMLELEKQVDPALEPEMAITIQRSCAAHWGSKVGTAPADDANLKSMLAETLRHHKRAAEIDQQYMPVAKRGNEAEIYIMTMLAAARGNPSRSDAQRLQEEAVRWLTQYLKDTDLPGTRQQRLRTLLAEIILMLNPTEVAHIDLLEKYAAEGDPRKLGREVSSLAEKVRRGQAKFQSSRALEMFIRLLDNPNRQIVASAAYLAAETALRRGEEDVPKAGKAIADRFEKELEINTAEQAELQRGLAGAVRAVGDKIAIERVVRHQIGMIEKTGEQNQVKPIMDGWCAEEFLRTIKGAPEPLSRMQRFSQGPSARWLTQLADAIAREREGS